MDKQDSKNIEDGVRPVGTVYITGDSVENGEVDLGKTITYLRGLESALKYYIGKEKPELVGRNYSIDVRVRPGSLVTEVIGLVVGAGALVGGVGIGAYVKTAAEQLAKNDMEGKTSAELAKDAVSSLKSTIRIAKHYGFMLVGRSVKQDQARAVSADEIILINSHGQEMTVTKREFDQYRITPKNELRNMMALVDKDTKLYIDDKPIDNEAVSPDAVSVDFIQKRVFDDRDDNQDERVIFPELTQDMRVTLEGELTRGNGRSNTLGFSYDGRILKCIPGDGSSIKSMRNMLFGQVRIEAIVDRRSAAKGSTAILKKPILRIISVESLEETSHDEAQAELFG